MSEPRRAASVHGPLRPGELAEVAVLGDLSLVLEVIGWFAPLGGAFQALAILPFAVLSARHRLRAGIIAVLSAATVAFLVGGVGIVLQTGLAGIVGLSIGTGFRRKWTPLVSVAITLGFAALPVAAVTDFIDFVSPGFRKLTFAQLRILWRDAERVLRLAGMSADAARGTRTINWIIAHWFWTVPLAEIVAILVVALVCLRLRVFLAIVTRSTLGPYTGGLAERDREAPGRVEPVPVEARGASYSYPSAGLDAVADVDLRVEPGRLVCLVGPNGSGKSTLVRLLAGRFEPTRGSIDRPGRPGYGERHGTAMVFQRPESQVLGVRVRDDLWWGLPAGSRPPTAELLALVGLEGMEERETATLSGGQLQRLAIAAALAREPRLVISDEATAMVDHEGREEIVSLLGRLRDEGIAVVHVTHRRAETLLGDAVAEMRSGRVVSLGPPGRPSSGRGPDNGRVVADEPVRSFERPFPLVHLRGVGYEYAAGTPWAHRALSGVDLEIATGEGIVVTGANGSGKTTLAWILGGLLRPSEGSALIAADPIDAVPERVGVAFQHARLQLLRPTVRLDVSAGTTEEAADEALRAVALDPSVMGPRKVDDLSGGEQRRVALAGLLVRRPDLLVLDEPYAGLDDEARHALAQVLGNLRRQLQVATVVVTHDLDNAEMLGHRLIRLEAGELAGEEAIG